MSITNFRKIIEAKGFLMPAQWVEKYNTEDAPFSRWDVDRWIHNGWLEYTKFGHKYRALRADMPLPSNLEQFCRERKRQRDFEATCLQSGTLTSFGVRRKDAPELQGETPAL